MRRVAIYIPSLRGGGAERAMVNLANSLSAGGYLIDLVVSNAVGPYESDVEERVNIIDLGSDRVAFGFFALVKYIKKNKPSVIISAMTHVNIAAILAKKISFSKAKLIVSERNNLSQVLKNDSSMKMRCLLFLMKILYPICDAIVSVSKGVEADILKHVKLGKSKSYVIYNSTIDENFYKKRSVDLVRKDIFDGEPVIIGVGRLVDQKDFSTLIKSFSLVIKEINCKLVILGDGEEKQKISKIIDTLQLNDKVHLVGFQDNPFPWIRESDVFVLSSKYEGLPNVLIQALGCHVNVVSTNCESGPSEILSNPSWGKLVPVGDIIAMAEAIIESIKKGKKGLDTVERVGNFRQDVVLDKWKNLINKINA